MAELKDKPKDFTLKDNTASKVIDIDPKKKIELEIGDAKDVEFRPQFKVKKWDNEVNLSIRAQEDPTATVLVEGDIIKYKATDYEVHHYEDVDGFNFELVLLKKPISNSFVFTIQTKGLDFFPQPALTPEEIAEGAERPENVIDSIAIYHSTKKNNIVGGMEYQAGKFGHLYRVEAINANGDKIYGTQVVDVNAGTLTKTVDDKWLSKAKYPVIIK